MPDSHTEDWMDAELRNVPLPSDFLTRLAQNVADWMKSSSAQSDQEAGAHNRRPTAETSTPPE
jgi:hypothetical protein